MKSRIRKTDLSRQNEPDTSSLGPRPGREQFRVPEGYFEALPARVQDAIREKAGGKRFIPIPAFFSRKIVMIPLSLAVIVAAGLLLLLPYQQQSSGVMVTASDSLKAAYDASYVADVQREEDLLLDSMIDNLPSHPELATPVIQLPKEEISEEAIIEYLKDQDLDIELLAEL